MILMPLGDTLQYSSKGFGKLYYKFFGVVDLHNHIRWQAIKLYIEVRDKNVREWELMSFEFVKTTGKPIDCVSIYLREVDKILIIFSKTK